MSVDVSSLLPLAELTNSDPAREQYVEELKKFRASDPGKELVAWALSTYKTLKAAREKDEIQWKRNLAMYNNRQFFIVNREGPFKGQLVEMPRDPKRDRRSVNRTAPIVRTEISKLTSQKPSASVLPASSDDTDMFAAMAGEQIWESISSRKQVQETLEKTAFWLSITGNGFIKSYWDESATDLVSGMPGDIVIEAVSPFNLLVPDLREEDIERQGFVINYYTKPVEKLKQIYALELEGVPLNPSTTAANEVIEESYLGLMAAGKASPDSCLIYEFWLKPGGCKHMPQGGRFVIVESTLVDYQTGPQYQHNEYPFAHSGHLLTGTFYRRSTLNDTNDLNAEYNDWRSHLNQSRRRMGHPQILSQKGSINAARWSNETGLVIEYKPGFIAPTPIPLAQLPTYILQEGQTILTDIEDISGQHQVSKGNVPPGVTAATAISYLQEKDDTYLTPTYHSFERMIEKVARQVLSLVVQYWDIPRTVKVAGDDNEFDVIQLSGADIASGTDIRVEPGSALPTSKAARQQFIIDLMMPGFIEPDKGLEMLEIGGATKLIDQLKVDKRQAQRENLLLKSLPDELIQQHEQQYSQMPEVDEATGQPLDVPPIVPVNEWDNHAVHIETHNNYRKSQAYRFLSPLVQQQFEQHVKLHQAMQIQQQIQQMLQSIPTDGSVPGVSGVVDPSTGLPAAEFTDGSEPGIDTSQFGTQEFGGEQSGVSG